MPEEKIGSKKVRGETAVVTVKTFNNGHKSFTAMEALALTQTVNAEVKKSHYFEENKHKMVRPRNPLTGEITPRDGNGEPLIREFAGEFPRKKEFEVTAKIGSYGNETRPQSSMDREMTRLRSIQFIHDNIVGELDYLKSKIAKRENQVQMSLLRNRLSIT